MLLGTGWILASTEESMETRTVVLHDVWNGAVAVLSQIAHLHSFADVFKKKRINCSTFLLL